MKQKQKQKQKQMQVVNVTVNAAEKKPVRRRAPRAKKEVAGDSIVLHHGDLPRPYPGYAPHGEPLRLAGPGQNYASLPAPLQRGSYASAPSVMNPQASPAFVSSADMIYGRNRNKNDDVRQIVNPSDITPMAKPSKRMSASTQTLTGAGFMPSVSSHDEDRSMEHPSFQGEVPRLNAADTSPSMRVVPSAPSASAVIQGNVSYPGFPLQEEVDEMAAEMEEDAGEFTSAAVSAFEPDSSSSAQSEVRKTVHRPTLTENQLMTPPTQVIGPKREDMLFRMLTAFGYKNARQDPQFKSTPGSETKRIAFIEDRIKEAQAVRRGKQPAMRRGGSVF